MYVQERAKDTFGAKKPTIWRWCSMARTKVIKTKGKKESKESGVQRVFA